MTDFLFSLVERSFGTAATIRPRVASLFEPARNHAEPATGAPEPRPLESFRDVAPSSQDSAPWTRRHAVSAADERTELGFEPLHPTTGSPAAGSVRHSRDVFDDLSTTPSSRGSVVRESLADLAPAPRPAPMARDTERRDVLGPTMPPHALASKGAAQDDDSGATPVASMAAPRAVERTEGDLLVPSGRGVEIAAGLQNAVSAWSARPRERDDGSRRATMEEATQAERNVHVTIGRIEVRAASGEKVPARERPVSPVMGLDEYLRRQVRRGGQ